jgi:hypothetical protein
VFTPNTYPRSIGIIELDRRSRKIFEFKGPICKIFRNKDLGRFVRSAAGWSPLKRLNLRLSKSADEWHGAASVALVGVGAPRLRHIVTIVARSGLGVCDGRLWLVVMKKVRSPTSNVADFAGTAERSGISVLRPVEPFLGLKIKEHYAIVTGTGSPVAKKVSCPRQLDGSPGP